MQLIAGVSSDQECCHLSQRCSAARPRALRFLIPPHFIPLPLVVLLISLCLPVGTLLIFPPFFWPFSDPGFSRSGWRSSDGQNGTVRWLESRAGSAQRRKRVPAAASPSAGAGARAGSASSTTSPWGGDQLQVPNHPVTCGQPLLPPWRCQGQGCASHSWVLGPPAACGAGTLTLPCSALRHCHREHALENDLCCVCRRSLQNSSLSQFLSLR